MKAEQGDRLPGKFEKKAQGGVAWAGRFQDVSFFSLIGGAGAAQRARVSRVFRLSDYWSRSLSFVVLVGFTLYIVSSGLHIATGPVESVSCYRSPRSDWKVFRFASILDGRVGLESVDGYRADTSPLAWCALPAAQHLESLEFSERVLICRAARVASIGLASRAARLRGLRGRRCGRVSACR